jgi:phage-related protein
MPIGHFSFNFRGKNSIDDFGIAATSSDFLLPQKRERKRSIPFRSGAYDYGSRWYNERELLVSCFWLNRREMRHTRSDIREIAYWLSSKGRIEFPHEEKFYIGELYDPNELIVHYDYSSQDNETTDGRFELRFVCEPFAYKDITVLPILSGNNVINYEGTAETDSLFIFKNESSVPISNIQVLVTRRRV